MNAAARQFGPVGRFAHVRFGAEQRPGLDHGLLEGQLLESVQRIVVDEHSNRTLLRKEMGRVVNRMAQFFLPLF